MMGKWVHGYIWQMHPDISIVEDVLRRKHFRRNLHKDCMEENMHYVHMHTEECCSA